MKTITLQNATFTLSDDEAKALREQLDAPKPSTGYWEPKKGEQYWCVIAIGFVGCVEWENCCDDKYRLAIGNIYRTDAEAQAEVDKRKATTRVRKYIAENGLEFVPDWDNPRQNKYVIGWRHSTNSWFAFDWSEDNYCYPFHFKSVDDAIQVIDNCDADLRIIWGLR